MADNKQGGTDNPQSKIVLAKPRLGGFGSSSANSSGSNKPVSVLQPPQLKPVLNNPFLKVTSNSEVNVNEKEKEEATDSKPESNNEKPKSNDVDPPKFVPLGMSAKTNSAVTPAIQPATNSSSASFVFGQNLSERVIMNEAVNNGDNINEHSTSNGTGALLFTSAANAIKDNQEEASTSDNNLDNLAAAAAEYERSHARPPPPTTDCITTGEEGEINVLQITCRLFAWEDGSWRERGRVTVRLNDTRENNEITHSRLVARVAGSLRVVLNTKLWPDMVVERAGNKSLRISAMDAQQQVKLFLIMGVPSEIAVLNRHMVNRVATFQRNATPPRDAFVDPVPTGHLTPPEDIPIPIPELEPANNERINANPQEEAETDEDSEKDNSSNDLRENVMKRKDSPKPDDEVPSKRPCPDILID